ncbi:MAG: hypothetical protein JO167_10865 [Alphaproteobacteria bacterium]|nr:hypothetical protein [Alphaproteobacteria bacterium]MBV9905262.1 hypothetical protein [Alphaproteobacteria bacterium]
MNLVLGFAPFILFAVLMRLSVDLALWVAFAAAFSLAMRSFLETRILKTLDGGNIALFGLLALYKGFIQPSLTFGAVLLAVDAGLLAIVVASVVLHEPFTLQYAREQVAPEQWSSRLFLRTNYVVTSVWILALALMTGADAAATFASAISVTMAAVASLVALAAALTFSLRYPTYLRRRAGQPAE